MNIAIAVDGDSLESPVAEQFELCRNLLIVNVDTMDVTTLPNADKSLDLAGQNLAESVLQYNCEAVITGLIRPTAFELIAGACVTRFSGKGFDAAKALELMHSNRLELIRDVNGGQSCGGSHHHH
jgi:predicted Fe-Mo cluster-binding NifX family protein